MLFIQATERKAACVTSLRVRFHKTRLLSAFEKIMIQEPTRKSEDNKTQNHSKLYFFPLLSSFSSFQSQSAFGLNITDNCCTLCSTYSCFQVFWCYKDIAKCGYCCSLTGIFRFQSNSCGQASFTIATLAVDRSQEATAAETESSSHLHIRTGTFIVGRSNVNAYCTLRKAQSLLLPSYLPEPEFTYRLINPLPSFTIATSKPWRFRKLKIDVSLPKSQHILNIFFEPSEAINGNNCLDRFF